jgi:hypothetical protein
MSRFAEAAPLHFAVPALSSRCIHIASRQHECCEHLYEREGYPRREATDVAYEFFTACIYSVFVAVHADAHAGEVRHESPCEDLFTYNNLIYLRLNITFIILESIASSVITASLKIHMNTAR